MLSYLKKNLVFCFSNTDKSQATARHEFSGVIQCNVVSRLDCTVLIIILCIRLCRRWTTVNLGWWSKCKCNFLLKVSKMISSSPTITTLLTRRSSPSPSAFRCTKRMLSQNQRVESKVLAWKRALYHTEKNAVIEKAHQKELLGQAFLPKNNAGNTHHFSSIITINPTAPRIKERKDAYFLLFNKLQYLLLT